MGPPSPYRWISYWRILCLRDVTTLRGKIAVQKARNASLRAQIAYAQSQEGAEAEARRAGFSRPGEQVYLLQEKPAEDGGRGR